MNLFLLAIVSSEEFREVLTGGTQPVDSTVTSDGVVISS